MKIGDKVRSLGEGCCFGHDAGKEGVIVQVQEWSEVPYLVNNTEYELWQCDNCLELVEEA